MKTAINLDTKAIEAIAIAVSQAVIATLVRQPEKEQPAKPEKTAKPEKAKPKAAKPAVKFTKTQERVVNGVVNRAEKHGYKLRFYTSGSWVWFENVNANSSYKTRSGDTRMKDTSASFAALQLSTKSTEVVYSKKRGQFCIKDFLDAAADKK